MSTQKPSRQSSTPYPGRNKTTPKTRIPRWIGLSVLLAGVASLSATAGAILAVSLSSAPLLQSHLTPEEAEVFNHEEPISTGNSLQLPRLTRSVNILVLGIKVLTSDLVNPPSDLQKLGYHALVNSFDGLSDTMLLIRFNPHTNQLAVLSIPRDTRTYIEGGLAKINEANLYGGPALTAESLSELLGGVAIDRYVRINVQGVEKLVESLGGIQVNVPKDMKYQDDSQHLYINLKAGEQRLNGDQALQFLRYRYDDYGDIGRIQRQQMLMRALVEQALTPTTIARLPKILSVIQSNVDTNLKVEELLALVGFAAQTNRSNIQMLMLPGDFSAPDEFELSYWLPNYGRIDQLVEQYFGFGVERYQTASDPSDLRVAIQDSTGDEIAVQSLIDDLYDMGYYNVFVDQNWGEEIEELTVTRILAQRGDVQSAETLYRFLGIGEVRVESTGNLYSDITIQLGQDWVDEHGDEL